jgi:hypothetical protein
MARLVLMLALFIFGGWLCLNLGNFIGDYQDDSQQYYSTIQMINNLEAPAAGGK